MKISIIRGPTAEQCVTTKQFGDACEHYVVAMLGFANVPAIKTPECWPGYDVIAQPAGLAPQRINVKGRRWTSTARAFRIEARAEWDWLAAVVSNATDNSLRCWLLPRSMALNMSTAMPIAGERRLNLTTLYNECAPWEGKFTIGAWDDWPQR